MANAKNFSAKDWELIKDAPAWVYAAVSAADSRLGASNLRNIRELKEYQKVVSEYKTDSELVKTVIAEAGDTPEAARSAKLDVAIKNLGKINTILEKQVDLDEGEDFRGFLVAIGHLVAAAGGEKMLGLGQKVSEAEADTIKDITAALKATAADKQTRKAAASKVTDIKDKMAKEAQAKRAEAAKQARIKTVTKAKKARAADEKEAEEEAAKKAAEERRLRAEKIKAETEIKMKAARAKKEAADKAREEAKAAAAAAEAAKFIGEHTVVSGDNLSAIAQKFYGSAARDKWMAIYEANKETIGDNPSLIRVGQVLQIPNLG